MADTKPPTVTVSLKNDTGTLATDKLTTDPTLRGSTGAADPNTVVTITDTVNSVTTVIGHALSDNTGAWSFTPTNLAGGAHSIKASATDTANNTGTSTALNFTLDTASPTVASFTQIGASSTNASTAVYDLKFSEGVTAPTAANFTLNSSGLTGASIGSITVVSSSEYKITVNTGTPTVAGVNGTFSLDFNGDNTVKDVAGHTLASPGSFHAETTTTVSDYNPFSLVAADFNGDGKADIAEVADQAGSLNVLLGDNTGALQSSFSASLSAGGRSIQVADFNGDGKADLAVFTVDTTNTVSVFTGNGDGTFNAPTNIAGGTAPTNGTVADVNGDGKADLIVIHNFANKVSTFLGNGDGTFGSAINSTEPNMQNHVIAVDVNGDGKVDLVAANGLSGNNVVTMLGNGDGSFQAGTTSAPGTGPVDVAAGDFNGDGKIDIALAAQDDGNAVVLLGNGDGTYATPVSYAAGTAPDAIVAADVNGDGIADLVLATIGNNKAEVLIGLGDGTFQAAVPYSLGAQGYGVTTADLNGDGRADIVAGASLQLDVLLANAPAANSGPTFTVDKSKPTVVVTADDTTLGAGQTATVTFTFNEAVQNFTNLDVTVAGGTLGTISDSGDHTTYTANFTPTVTDTFTGSITVKAGGYQDLANNAGTASTPLTFTGDTKAPVVTAKLLHDTGSSTSDGISSDVTLTGTGDKNATVHFTIDGVDSGDEVTASSTGTWTFSKAMADGAHTVVATEIDAAGNIGTATIAVTHDTTAPHIVGNITQNGGPYGPNHPLIISFDVGDGVTGDRITVTGAPSLTLSNGEKATYSAADSNLANGHLAFKYTPTAGHDTADLQISNTATLPANSIKDVAGNDASATIAGQIANFDFSAAVDATKPSSVATLAHDTGSSSTDKITNDRGIIGTSDALATIVIKEGTVVVGNTTANGSGEWSFDPGGGLTETKHTYSVTTTDPAGNVSTASSLAFTYDVTAPTLVSAVSSAATVKSGDTISLTLNFSENAFVNTASPPILALDGGGSATYVSGSGTKALKYSYTPTGTQASTDLQITAASGDFTDVAGNTLASAAKDIVFGTNGNVVSTFAPAATASVDGDGNFKATEPVTIHLHFNENVTVTGTPQIKLSDGGIASYATGSGTNDLTFTYTVGAHDNANPLKISSVNLNGGSIKDGSDVPANLTNMTNANLGVVIDTTAPKLTAKLLHDDGISATDKLTNDLSVTGTGEAGSTVVLTENSIQRGATTVAANGTWTIAGDTFADGMNKTVTVTETDLVGNVTTTVLSGVKLDTTIAQITSFTQVTGATTNAASVVYDLKFNEAVTGVVAGDFALTQDGVTGASITGVKAISSTAYQVTVATGKGDGGLHLDYRPTQAHDFAGNGFGGGYFGDSQHIVASVSGDVAIAVGDVNGDGKLDLISLSSFTDSGISLGNGDGTFQDQVAFNLGTQTNSATMADLNGDNRADLIATNLNGNGVAVGLGNADGTLSLSYLHQDPTGSPVALAVGDLNGDGIPDIVESDGAQIAVFFNNGSGTFANTNVIGAAVNYLAVGDFDGDGKGDIAFTTTANDSVSVVLGDGTGGFAGPSANSTGDAPGKVLIADLDGDHNLDLVTANGSGTVSVLKGNGDGTFEAAVNYTTGAGANDVVAEDFNQDGYLDLAVADATAQNIAVLFGAGDGTFGPAELFDIGGAGRLVTGDFNNDGRIDIAMSTDIATSGGNASIVLFNEFGARGGTFAIDKIVPVVSVALDHDNGKSATDNITNHATVSGSGDANANVTIKEGNTVLGTASADAAGNWQFIPSGLSQGIHTLTATETDAAGNTGTASLKFTYDTTTPTITKVAATPSSGALPLGGTVKIVLTGSEALNVTGTPVINLDDGGHATYTSGSGTTALTFTYTAGAGQNTSALAVTGLDFTNGTIFDTAGNDATTVLAQTFTGLKIDTTAPTFQNFTVVGAGADGKIATGETLNVVLHYDDALKFGGGAPKISLSDGQVLSYNAAGSNLANGDVSFQTVITAAAGHNGALSLGGLTGFPNSTFTDLAGNQINALNISGLGVTGVTEDTSAPTAQTAVGSDADGDPNIAAGKLVTITVTLSEVVNVTGPAPTLKLSDGKIATYTSGSGSDTLNFTFTVQSNETTNFADLKVSSLTLPSGAAIKDDYGNPVTATTFNNLDTGIAIDGVAPAVTAVSIPVATPKALMAGDTVVITLAVKDITTGGDQLFPAGNPTLQLSNGGIATFVSNTNTSLTFSYTVGAESTTDLKVTGFNFDSSNRITDDAGNPVTLASNLASADLKISTNVFTFKTTGDHDWHTATNWTPNGDPEAGSTAIVATSGQTATISGTNVGIASLVTAKGAEVDVNGANLAITRDATNAGTLKLVGQGHTIALGTIGQPFAFNNTGTVSVLAGEGDATLKLFGDTTMSGTGGILVLNHNADGGDAKVVSDGVHEVRLTNGTATVAHTIQGSGTLGDSHLLLTNAAKGVITANDSANQLVISAENVTNAGMMQATNAGMFIETNAIFNTGGTIQAVGTGTTAAFVTIFGGNITGGTFFANGTNAEIDVSGGTFTGGTFKTTGANAAVNFEFTGAATNLNGVTNTGTMNLLNGANVTLGGGTFNNTSTGLVNVGNNANLIVGSDLTMTGGGKVNLTGTAFSSAVKGDGVNHATLTNGMATVAHTIQGTGAIGDGFLSITNSAKGTIVTSGGSLIVQGTTSNAGLLEGTAGQVLALSANVANTGIIEALGTNATVRLNTSSVTNSGANANILLSGTNAQLELNSASVTGGKISMVGGGFVDVINSGGASTLHGITSNGLIQVENGGTLQLTGGSFVNNKGTVSVLDGALDTFLQINGNLSLSGGGNVVLGGAHAKVIGFAGETLTNVGNVFSGVGTLGDSQLTFVNASGGIVNANDVVGSLTIATHAVTNNAGGIIEGTKAGGLYLQTDTANAGTIEANAGKLVISGGSVTQTGAGNLLSTGANAVLQLASTSVTGGAINVTTSAKLTIGDSTTTATTTINNNGGEIDFNGGSETVSGAVNNNTGSIEVLNSTSATFEGLVTNKATIDVVGNSTMWVMGSLNNSGTLHIGGGGSLQDRGVSFTNSKTVTIDAGSNSSVALNGTITNSGTFTVGDNNAVGICDNQASTTVNNTGTFAFAGTGSNTRLFISNSATLTGGGKITFADADHQSITTAGLPASLINGNATAGNTISGAVTFSGPDLSFDNTAKGTVSATFLGHSLTFSNSGTVHNEGTFQSSGWMTILNTTVDQSNATTGVIKATAAGAHIDLNAASITGGQLTTVANSTVNFANEITLTNVKATDAGTFHVDDTLHLAGTTALSVSSGGHLVLETATVDSGGAISTAAGSFIDVLDDDNDSGTTAQSTVTAAITNAGTINIDSATFVLHGNLTNTGAVKVVDHGAFVLDGATMTAGTLNVDATSSFGVGQDATIGSAITNAGTIIASPYDLTINGAVNNTGSFTAGSGAQLVFGGAVSGIGSVHLDGSASVEFKNATTTSNVVFGSYDQQLILDHALSFNGTISGFGGASHSTFTDMAAFGDSTIDSGWFPTALDNGDTANETGSTGKNHFIQNAVDHGGGGDPVGNGLMNSEVLGGDFGIDLRPADSTGGGNNYAISGALSNENAGSANTVNLISGGTGIDPGNSDPVNGSPSGDGNLNKNPLLPSTVSQIGNFLTEHSGVADSGALYLISSGGNDSTFASTLKSNGVAKPNYLAYLQDQAYALADKIHDFQAAGAQTILVHGLSGDNGGAANGNFAAYFDTALFSRLDADGVDYIRSDVSTLLSAMVAHPSNFGFTAGTVAKGTPGTTSTASAFIDLETTIQTGWGQWGAPTGQMPQGTNTDTTHSATGNYAYLRAPNAEYTSIYSDDQHFSTQGQQFEANFDLGLLFSAGALDMPSIDFGDVAYAIGTTTATYTGTDTGGTLTVIDAANHKATLTLDGDYRDYDFITVSDGHGGTDVITTNVSGADDIIDNTGLNGVANVTAGMLGAEIVWTVGANVTLSSEVTLTSAETIVSKGSAVTLTNTAAIDGGGAIGDSFMTLINSATGIISADDDHNGMLIQAKTFTNSGTIEAINNGWLDIASVVGGNAQVGTGGLLEFGNASSANVTFLDNDGTLKLDVGATAATKFTGTISGFQQGNHIDLADINFTTGFAQLSFNETTDKLTITDGMHSEVLTFSDGLTLASFNATQDITHHVDLLHV